MARPKTPTDARREFRIVYRCTATEYAKLLDRADQAKQPVNAYARQASLSSTIRIVQQQSLDFDTRHQLRGIATNLNQIAHALNAGEQALPPNLETAIQKYIDFMDKDLPQ